MIPFSFRDLEYIVAVADVGHFGQAAERCHVSQPALSAQIKKVEDSLGMVIFERNNRSVRVAENMLGFIETAREVLSLSERLVEEAKKPNEPLGGTFRLGVIATLGPYYVPRFLVELRKKYPRLELVLREGLTDELLVELKDGRLDAVLAARTFDEAPLRIYPILQEPFVVAAPLGHPILTGKEMTVARLDANDMVLLGDGHCLRDESLQLCRPSKRRGARAFQATSAETLKHLVASGLGYTLLPIMAMREDKALAKLIAYRAFDKPVGRAIVLATRPETARSRDVREMASFLRQHVPAECLAAKST